MPFANSPFFSFRTACFLVGFSLSAVTSAASAHAGPLGDWLFGRQAPAYPVGTPVPVTTNYPYVAQYPAAIPYTAAYPTVVAPASAPIVAPVTVTQPVVPAPSYTTNFAPSPTWANTQTSGVAPGTMYSSPQQYLAGYGGVPVPTANFVPSNNYDTRYYRAPVTYYRPMVTTDPRTGQQVTVLAPCTSYQMQAQRVPTFSFGNWLFGSGTPQYMTGPAPAPITPQPTPVYGTNGLPQAGVAIPSNTSFGTYPPSTVGSIQTPSMPTYSAPLNFPTGTTTTSYGAMYQSPPVNPGIYPNTTSGGSNGGCTGSYSSGYSSSQSTGPVYGSAPSSGIYPNNSFPPPPSVSPYPPAPGTSAPFSAPGSIPGTSSGAPPGFNPSAITPSTDPAANEVPSLPVNPPPPTSQSNAATPSTSSNVGWNSNRVEPPSKLQSVVRQPSSKPDAEVRTIEKVDNGSNEKDLPPLQPIPTPKDFEETPRWNPGLLNATDRTAYQKRKSSSEYKAIQWASYEEPASVKSSKPVASTPSNTDSGIAPRRSLATPKERPRYSTDGWKASKN